jgi:hypothetical protein
MNVPIKKRKLLRKVNPRTYNPVVDGFTYTDVVGRVFRPIVVSVVNKYGASVQVDPDGHWQREAQRAYVSCHSTKHCNFPWLEGKSLERNRQYMGIELWTEWTYNEISYFYHGITAEFAELEGHVEDIGKYKFRLGKLHFYNSQIIVDIFNEKNV